jgi:CheY-like chemotaxis protein
MMSRAREQVTVPARVLQGRQWRVLVADDNVVNQLVSAKTLAKLHCHVDTVANGAEALEAVATLPYDLVLMDCQMPVMDGYEAARAIRTLDGRAATIPIIAVTANAMPSERARCLAAGMNDYVTKPVSLSALAEVLSRWLPESAASDAA